MPRTPTGADQWERLETYRQRYPIEERLRPLTDLERSMSRRRSRSAALSRRLEELHEQTARVRKELRTIDAEISGSRETGALLIEEIIEQVRVEMGEAWSPSPVRGFRVWRIQDNKMTGNQVHWPAPTLVSECLRGLPGEDLPHPIATCGPPACGIYAVKDLDMFGTELAIGTVDRSVVGVVAMTGKVVEHEDGYRSQCATAMALVARLGAIELATSDRDEIEDLFDDPGATVSHAGTSERLPGREIREFLESMQSKEDQWI